MGKFACRLAAAFCFVMFGSAVWAEDFNLKADTLGDESDFTFTDDKNYPDAGAGPDQFPYFPKKGYEKSECGTDMEDDPGSPTFGPYEYSCRTTNLYTTRDTGMNWKFEGLSCRKGNLWPIARFKSRGNNDHIIMKNTFGLSLVFRRQIIHCVRVGDEAPGGGEARTSGDPPDGYVTDRTPMITPDIQRRLREEEEARARRDREQAEARARQQAEEVRKRTLVVSVQSFDKYAVHLSFHAKGRNNAWPGGDQIYPLADSAVHTFRLSCIPNEQICYGAGRSGNYDRYWGVGVNGGEGCTGCCMTCGYTYSYTLQGGPDGSPGGQGSGGGISQSTLDDFIGAAGGLAGAIGGGGGGGSTYRPAPRQRPSCITQSGHAPVC